jgi:hypothetical protein
LNEAAAERMRSQGRLAPAFKAGDGMADGMGVKELFPWTWSGDAIDTQTQIDSGGYVYPLWLQNSGWDENSGFAENKSFPTWTAVFASGTCPWL